MSFSLTNVAQEPAVNGHVKETGESPGVRPSKLSIAFPDTREQDLPGCFYQSYVKVGLVPVFIVHT